MGNRPWYVVIVTAVVVGRHGRRGLCDCLLNSGCLEKQGLLVEKLNRKLCTHEGSHKSLGLPHVSKNTTWVFPKFWYPKMDGL